MQEVDQFTVKQDDDAINDDGYLGWISHWLEVHAPVGAWSDLAMYARRRSDKSGDEWDGRWR